MNQYGVIAQRHWRRWLPKQYAALGDLESFFTTLGEEVARQIDDLTDKLIGEIRQDDSYLVHVGRLFAARAIAEELILPQRVLPDPELAADNQGDVPPEGGERPMIVKRGATTRHGQKWTQRSRSAFTVLRLTSEAPVREANAPPNLYQRGVGALNFSRVAGSACWVVSR